ncbi:C1q-related factor-like isoform X2 [Ruditapes philippinarum]|uniref:C1q-related factor-like isoform X2 n=1 Tax=Ruditapes philippinarum TaxID=129788 RepID=UPI00295B3A1D|nr:C1q-related factor-like isoform X2 [Ruditapes philippinarum]
MCSKFSYEKEIITNMLKMELKVEKMEQEVKKRNEDIVTMLDAQRKEMEKFANDYKNLRDILVVVMENKTAAVNSFLEDKAVNVLGDKIAEVDDALKIMTGKVDGVLKAAETGLTKPIVAFSAHVGPTKLHIPQNQIIVFSFIITNVGNGYKSASGKFVAPVAGYYLLSCSLISWKGEEFWASIYINNSKKASLNEKGADSRHGMASQTIIVELKANDVVSVKTPNNNAINIHGLGYSTFSGVLIH